MAYACLMLPFPPTVNNLFVNSRRTGGRFPSTQYKLWRREAARVLAGQAPLPRFGDAKVVLTFSFGRPDKRRRDLFNYVKAPEDMLVEAGVIADDSLVERGTVQWAAGVTGCRVEIEDWQMAVDDAARLA